MLRKTPVLPQVSPKVFGAGTPTEGPGQFAGVAGLMGHARPLAFLLLIFGAGRGMRRFTRPMDDLIDAAGRIERTRLFLSEVRNELKRVTWPTQKEVYATTVVVILTSIFFGLYLFILDYGLNSLVQWIFRRFGAA